MSTRLTRRPCGVGNASPQCTGSAVNGPSGCTCREPVPVSPGLLDGVNARLDYLESKVTVNGVKRLDDVERDCGMHRVAIELLTHRLDVAIEHNVELAMRVEKLEEAVVKLRANLKQRGSGGKIVGGKR